MSDERDNEMTPKLEAGLRGLRRELAPSHLLEVRIVRALKTRGLLRPQRIWERSLRWATAIGAALVLFFSGLTLGRRMAATRYASNRSPATLDGQTLVVEQVRQTGAAYVRAMSALKGASSDKTRDQGREVALDSLLAAAGEISRVQQDDSALTRAIQALRRANGMKPQLSSTSRQIFWF